jgi:hypothetical protein
MVDAGDAAVHQPCDDSRNLAFHRHEEQAGAGELGID